MSEVLREVLKPGRPYVPSVKHSELPVVHPFAEVWLHEAMEYMRPRFAELGYEIPPVNISVGFGSAGFKSGSKRPVLGWCYARRMSAAWVNDIYITPLVEESDMALSVLAHELVHAIDDCESGHGPRFKQISKDLKLTDCAQVSLSDFRDTVDFYRRILGKIGRYPRSGIRYQHTQSPDITYRPSPISQVQHQNMHRCN